MTLEPRHGYLDVEDGRLVCHECARTYLHLATHVRLAHDLTAAEYDVITAGYSINALARAVDRPSVTVAQRLRRHPARRTVD